MESELASSGRNEYDIPSKKTIFVAISNDMLRNIKFRYKKDRSSTDYQTVKIRKNLSKSKVFSVENNCFHIIIQNKCYRIIFDSPKTYLYLVLVAREDHIDCFTLAGTNNLHLKRR